MIDSFNENVVYSSSEFCSCPFFKFWRKVRPLFSVMANAQDAYDSVAVNTMTVEERQGSRTIHLRQFNNWIKSVLIARYCPSPHASILDMACGKGGDIPKWKRKDPNQFVFGDISPESLLKAYEKYASVKCPTRAFFLCGDIFKCDLKQFIPSDLHFHISSCQMAFHYSFKTEELARSAVRNLCERLVSGGYVLLTIPNACRIVKLLREKAPETRISNELFFIERNFELDNIPMFGAEYIFHLVESVPPCPEYLVHPEVMKALFREYNCKCVEEMEFHKYYSHALEHMPDMKMLFLELLERLEMDNAAMTKEEWDIISLYSCYVFQKDDGKKPKPLPSEAKYREPKRGDFQIMHVDDGTLEDVHIPLENRKKRRD